jgi:hypothetical protein
MAVVPMGSDGSAVFVGAGDVHDMYFETGGATVVMARHDKVGARLCVDRADLATRKVKAVACFPSDVGGVELFDVSPTRAFGALHLQEVRRPLQGSADVAAATSLLSFSLLDGHKVGESATHGTIFAAVDDTGRLGWGSRKAQLSAIEVGHGACSAPPVQLTGVAPTGAACSNSTECAPQCCACGGPDHYLAALCFEGTCATADLACGHTQPGDICTAISEEIGSREPYSDYDAHARTEAGDQILGPGTPLGWDARGRLVIETGAVRSDYYTASRKIGTHLCGLFRATRPREDGPSKSP